MAEPFYTQVDANRFESSPQTAGPWGPDSQHAGPPSALLARAIEQFQPRDGSRLGRVGVDTLSPVPVGPLGIEVTPDIHDEAGAVGVSSQTLFVRET